MRTLLSIFFLLILNDLSGQRWTKISGGEIEFSHFTNSNRENWFSVDFEYFKKGKKLIGVPRGLTEEFFAMVQETPIAFDSIYNNSRQKTTKTLSPWRHYDSSLLKLDYTEAVIFEGWTVVKGHNEIIWILQNYSWSGQQIAPCYTHVVFTHKKKSDHKFYNLIFLSAFFEGCEI